MAGLIVFDQSGCGISVINPDGHGLKRLSDRGSKPRWSPDGRWLAFQAGSQDDDDYSDEIFIMRADGTDVQQVTRHRDLSAGSPAWSPDGRRLAYRLFMGRKVGINKIHILDIATGRSEVIAEVPEPLFDFMWIPSGELVMNCNGYQCMDPKTGTTRPLTILPEYGGEPDWSPDGHRIAFTNAQNRDNWKLCYMNWDGSDVREVPTTNHPVSPSWSPNGDQLVYRTFDDREGYSSEIYIINLDGSGETRIFTNPMKPNGDDDMVYEVAWCPVQSSYHAAAGLSKSTNLQARPAKASSISTVVIAVIAFLLLAVYAFEHFSHTSAPSEEAAVPRVVPGAGAIQAEESALAPGVAFQDRFDQGLSNWSYSIGSGNPNMLSNGGLEIIAPRIGSSIFFRSNRVFTGNLATTFSLEHRGFGRTTVGLVLPNTQTWISSVTLDTDDTAYLAFGSQGRSTEYKYSSAPYLNHPISLDLIIKGDEIAMGPTGGFVEHMTFIDIASYQLAFAVGSVTWKSGDNQTRMYSVSAGY